MSPLCVRERKVVKISRVQINNCCRRRRLAAGDWRLVGELAGPCAISRCERPLIFAPVTHCLFFNASQHFAIGIFRTQFEFI